jgi:hypothetical protein
MEEFNMNCEWMDDLFWELLIIRANLGSIFQIIYKADSIMELVSSLIKFVILDILPD